VTDAVSPESLFSLAGFLAAMGWLLLAIVPRWRLTMGIAGVFLPLALAGLYLGLVLVHLVGADGGFSSLEQVARLFEDRWLLLAGWVHYLAFDLFVGAWEVRDAQRLALPHLAVLPCLVLTFLLGPVGLLAYFLVRATMRGAVTAVEVSEEP
jgi:hypothetical protein